jgi:ATP-binding cassette subfamily B protein
MYFDQKYEISKDDYLAKVTDIQFLRRMVVYALPYRLQLALAVVVMLLYAMTSVAQPYLFKVAIDQYILPGDGAGLYRIAMLYLGLLCAEFTLFYTQIWLLQSTGQKIIYDIRQAIFKHLQTMSVKFFDRNPVGRLVTRVTNDTEAIKDMYTDVLVHLCGDIFMLFGIMGIMLYLYWQLALLVFTVILIVLLVSTIYRSRARVALREIRAQLAQINATLQENISGIRVIQAFRTEFKKYREFDQINLRHYQANLKDLKVFAVFRPLIDLIHSAALTMILWYGGGAVLQSQIEVGTLFAFITYIDKFFSPIKDLTEKYNILQSALAAAERVFALLDQQPEIQDPSFPAKVNDIKGKIEFKNVWFAYDQEDWILKNVSFEIQPGETIAIVGSTGAGKTTIINLINRLYDIQQGQILIDDVDIRELAQADLRRMIGVVFQDVFLFTGTIEENIRLNDPEITDDQVRQAARQVHAELLINKLPQQYETKIQQRGATLSFGERQLLAFARTLAFNRPILVLDEATANIDSETEALIQKALEALIFQRTTIIIAHRLSTIQRAERILVMHKGRIHEQGTHQQLLAKQGMYYRLYQMQFQ